MEAAQSDSAEITIGGIGSVVLSRSVPIDSSRDHGVADDAVISAGVSPTSPSAMIFDPRGLDPATQDHAQAFPTASSLAPDLLAFADMTTSNFDDGDNWALQDQGFDAVFVESLAHGRGIPALDGVGVGGADGAWDLSAFS